MVAIAISPFLDQNKMPPRGIVVTAVLPGGCTFDCSFCAVARRNERHLKSTLSPEHYAGLLRALAERNALGAAAIVGDEPLQKHSWPYAGAYLREADQAGVNSALITNGFELHDFMPNLIDFPNTEIIVSLDGIGARHERVRRMPGAFTAIERGLRRAVEDAGLRRRLVIGSILMPNNSKDIADVIRFASALGISRVAVSPLLVIDEGKPLRVHPRVLADGWRVISELDALAKERDVDLCLSDDFCTINNWKDSLRSVGIDIRAPAGPGRLIRFDGGGRIDTYDDIRRGTSCGLRLPADFSCFGEIAARIIDTIDADLQVAA